MITRGLCSAFFGRIDLFLKTILLTLKPERTKDEEFSINILLIINLLVFYSEF